MYVSKAIRTYSLIFPQAFAAADRYVLTQFHVPQQQQPVSKQSSDT